MRRCVFVWWWGVGWGDTRADGQACGCWKSQSVTLVASDV
jgi:hypothetical protein